MTESVVQTIARATICEGMGWPAQSIKHCERIKRDWARWDKAHGFGWRCMTGVTTLSDENRLAEGDEPPPGAPPPYLHLLA